jgi:hypothetical protein
MNINIAFPFAFAFAFTFTLALAIAHDLTFTLILIFSIQLALSQRSTNTVMFLEVAQQKMIIFISGFHKLIGNNTISTKMKSLVR